jgi:hypothetical protein
MRYGCGGKACKNILLGKYQVLLKDFQMSILDHGKEDFLTHVMPSAHILSVSSSHCTCPGGALLLDIVHACMQ